MAFPTFLYEYFIFWRISGMGEGWECESFKASQDLTPQRLKKVKARIKKLKKQGFEVKGVFKKIDLDLN